MLKLYIEDAEMYDSEANEFLILEGGVFRFEHTLKAISEWESIYKKPFMTSNLSKQELKDYFTMMSLDDGLTYRHINEEVYTRLLDYIGDSMTATVVTSNQSGTTTSVITSELIYSMMVAAGVPFEAEYWNVNRLLILLEVIAIQNQPKKEMSKAEIYEQNRKLNEERKRKFNTRG